MVALRATGVSASGMAAQMFAQAITADNIANLDTPVFKASEAVFSAINGGGVRLAATPANVQQGALIFTGNPFDFAIGGAGFFELEDSRGAVLTRGGSFVVDERGMLTDSEGRIVQPGIRLPQGTARIQVNSFGDVVAIGADDTRSYVGTLRLATVANPRGLVPLGGNVLGLSPAAGKLVDANPGTMGFGMIVQGGLEASNVELIDQSIRSVVSARAFDANAAVFRVASAMAAQPAEMAAPEAPRSRKRPTGRVDLRKTQASRLVSVFGGDESGVQAAPLNPELRARLAARHMQAPEIAEAHRIRRKHQPERLRDDFGGRGNEAAAVIARTHGEISAELMIARRRAAELRQAG